MCNVHILPPLSYLVYIHRSSAAWRKGIRMYTRSALKSLPIRHRETKELKAFLDSDRTTSNAHERWFLEDNAAKYPEGVESTTCEKSATTHSGDSLCEICRLRPCLVGFVCCHSNPTLCLYCERKEYGCPTCGRTCGSKTMWSAFYRSFVLWFFMGLATYSYIRTFEHAKEIGLTLNLIELADRTRDSCVDTMHEMTREF